MTNYIIRRLLLIPILLFGVTVIIFSMLQFLGPVERSALYIKDFPKNDNQIQGIIKKYKLDKPIYEQYWIWLVGHKSTITGERTGGIIFGDFGYSRTGSQPVIDIIKDRFPNTLDLALWTVFPMLSVGIWLGVQAAVHQNGFIDQAARIFSIIGTSFPTFVFGLLVLIIFYANLQWFPPGKMSDWVSQLLFSGEFHSYTKLLSIDALSKRAAGCFLGCLETHDPAHPYPILYQLGDLCKGNPLFHAGDIADGLRSDSQIKRTQRKRRYQ